MGSGDNLKVAVVLSGCGFQDGAEIYESVFSLLSLERQGFQVTAFAPDITQDHVTNHLTGDASGEARNVLVESARLMRGKISDLNTMSSEDFDALVMPGGFGAALNLSTFATKGANMAVNEKLASLVKTFYDQKKPIVAICIAPAVVAKVLGDKGIEFTIGNDSATAKVLESWGAKHVNCAVDDCVIDTHHRVITTPAYMLGQNMDSVFRGIEKAIGSIKELI